MKRAQISSRRQRRVVKCPKCGRHVEAMVTVTVRPSRSEELLVKFPTHVKLSSRGVCGDESV